MILGVCRGLAEHLGISVFWTRFVTAALLLMTGVWPIVGLYILAAFLMKLEPMIPFVDEEGREFYDSYVNSREMGLNRLKRTFDSLNSRLGRMEDIVTAKEFNWDRRFNKNTP